MTKDIIKKKFVLGCLLNQIQISFLIFLEQPFSSILLSSSAPSFKLSLLGSYAFIPLGDLTNEIQLTFWKRIILLVWFFCSTPSGGCNSTKQQLMSNARIDSREGLIRHLESFSLLARAPSLSEVYYWTLSIVTRTNIFKYPQVQTRFSDLRNFFCRFHYYHRF